MDFSKLNSNEKLGLYGAIGVIIGGAAGGSVSGLGWLALLAAIAMGAVILLPMFSPTTTLPGSKGSLMLVTGAIAGVIMLLALLVGLQYIGVVFGFAPISAILFLIAVAGGLLMAWAGWQEFQAEGGKFQMGSAPAGGAATTSAAPPAQTAPPPAPAASTPPPAEPMRTDEPMTPPPSSTPGSGESMSGGMGTESDDDRA
jgi:hypothetical protein